MVHMIRPYINSMFPTIKTARYAPEIKSWLRTYKHNSLHRYFSSNPRPPPPPVPPPVDQAEREQRKEMCPPETSPYWKNIPLKLPNYHLVTLIEVDDDAIMQPPPNKSSELEILLNEKCFDGHLKIYRHYSKETKCYMKFTAYIPLQKTPDEKFNTLFFLSGLMCNEWNFLFKTGFHRYASENRIMVIGPDTSPRNCNVPWERESWVCGRSAGWFLDALNKPWDKHYRMYSYVTKELPEIVKKHLPTTGTFGIMGHSMGGNGAIVIALRNPNLYKTISAISPSCNPTNWGEEIMLTPFLGTENRDKWKLYDASLVAAVYEGPYRKLIVDCGAADELLVRLRPHKLVEAAEGKDCLDVELNMREGYKHSYLFVATFMEDHIKYHAKALSSSNTQLKN